MSKRVRLTKVCPNLRVEGSGRALRSPMGSTLTREDFWHGHMFNTTELVWGMTRTIPRCREVSSCTARDLTAERWEQGEVDGHI